MEKVFFVRHQAHGVVHQFPFAQHPTQEQVEAIKRFCFQLHGFGHPKTPEEPYWVRVVEVDVLGDELPDVPERVLAPAGEPGVGRVQAGQVGVSGVGRVTPAGKDR